MTTVLVVDDDPAITAVVRDILEWDGYTVLDAVGGAAIPLARDAHPDVILLDLTMPGMDGIEVSKRLRADPQTTGIPIIVMSAVAKLQANAAEMQADDQLAKPFDLSDLYATVERWVQRP